MIDIWMEFDKESIAIDYTYTTVKEVILTQKEKVEIKLEINIGRCRIMIIWIERVT